MQPHINIAALHIFFFVPFEILDIACTLTVLCLKGGDICIALGRVMNDEYSRILKKLP